MTLSVWIFPVGAMGWRPELLARFTREMYGVMPPRSPKQAFVVFDKGTVALGGKAIRRQITILIDGDPRGPRFDLLLYTLRAAKGPVPAILGINFWGNHAVTPDPGVRLTLRPVESVKNSYADLTCADGLVTITPPEGKIYNPANHSQWMYALDVKLTARADYTDEYASFTPFYEAFHLTDPTHTNTCSTQPQDATASFERKNGDLEYFDSVSFSRGDAT